MGYYLIWGLGISGMSAVDFLMSKTNKIKVYDDNIIKLREMEEKNLIPNCVVIDKINPNTLADVECIVLSPTVRIGAKIKELILRLGIDVVGEFGLASRYNIAPIYAVTGTNGKTTTVNMLHTIFTQCGINSHLVGNVGIPFTSVVNTIQPVDKVVAELSSFQLENITGVKASAVAITNIAPDHMDMYGSFDEYVSAKRNIMSVEGTSRVFLNYDDAILRDWGDERCEYFSLNPLPNEKNGLFIQNGKVCTVEQDVIQPIMNVPNITGSHNLSNWLCAVSLARWAGVGDTQIEKVHFSLPRHRQEIVKVVDGVTFVNDSKATNIHAVKSALQSFGKSRIVLMLGGKDKGEDYQGFLSTLSYNVKVIVFGQMRHKLIKILKKLDREFFECADVYEAVAKSKQIATVGDVVLFSPGGASFDEFACFEERGDYFCELVNEL